MNPCMIDGYTMVFCGLNIFESVIVLLFVCDADAESLPKSAIWLQ